MGKAVLLVPCNLNPNSLFVGMYDLRKEESETPFETAVNAFDSTGFKKVYPDLFTEYSRETSYKRFCVL